MQSKFSHACEKLLERVPIHWKELTKGEQKVADFLVDNGYLHQRYLGKNDWLLEKTGRLFN